MELKEQLQELATKLEGKSKEQVQAEVKSLEAKFNDSVKNEVKEVKEVLTAEFEAKLKLVQEHADNLDVKLQEQKTQVKAKATSTDQIKELIKENADSIKEVRKGKEVEIKAVANMTTANLTGDEPRSYNYDIVSFPSQKVNVADLVGSVNIDGGTYTYTVEGAGEGSIGAQTEGNSKNQRDYDFTTVDVTTDFIAGFARYSKKMRNNLSYITSAIPNLLRRDYFKSENAAFNTILATDATASTEVITGSSKVEMLMNEVAKLEDLDYDTNGIAIRPSDYMDILKAAKDDLQSAVSYEGGVLRVAGVQVLKATWLAANKYFVGDWSRVNKVNTEGLSLEFSDSEGENFVKNNITARIESQTALAVEQPLALVYGDFTAV
jgi:HK97 family phage major capsid protein